MHTFINCYLNNNSFNIESTVWVNPCIREHIISRYIDGRYYKTLHAQFVSSQLIPSNMLKSCCFVFVPTSGLDNTADICMFWREAHRETNMQSTSLTSALPRAVPTWLLALAPHAASHDCQSNTGRISRRLQDSLPLCDHLISWTETVLQFKWLNTVLPLCVVWAINSTRT